jgi:hypothetical protein
MSEPPTLFLLAVTTQGRQLAPIGPFADYTQRLIRARRMYNDYAGDIAFSRLDIDKNVPTLTPIGSDEIDQVDLFEIDPQFCPRCGGTNISVAVVEWPAHSADDPANTATLFEHQCQDCDGASFFT